jgi:hypothetical protein
MSCGIARIRLRDGGTGYLFEGVEAGSPTAFAVDIFPSLGDGPSITWLEKALTIRHREGGTDTTVVRNVDDGY